MTIYNVTGNIVIPDFNLSIPASSSDFKRKVILFVWGETSGTVTFRTPTFNNTAFTFNHGGILGGNNAFGRVYSWDEAQLPASAGSYVISQSGCSAGVTGDCFAYAVILKHSTGNNNLLGTASSTLTATSGNFDPWVAVQSPQIVFAFASDPDASTITRLSSSHADFTLLDSSTSSGSTSVAIGQCPFPGQAVKTFGFTRVSTGTIWLMFYISFVADSIYAAGDRVTRPITVKSATANSANATSLKRSRPLAAKGATASNTKADLTSTPAGPTGNLVTTGLLVMHL